MDIHALLARSIGPSARTPCVRRGRLSALATPYPFTLQLCLLPRPKRLLTTGWMFWQLGMITL